MVPASDVVEGAGRGQAASNSRALQNVEISINEYLDGSKAANSRKLERQVIKLFQDTISSLSKIDASVVYKQLDDYCLVWRSSHKF